jgi:23S rRNA G2445 N2-methylase RlmL
MTNIFAITTRGLEQIGAAEMARQAGVQVGQISYRRVCASVGDDLAGLLALRTVDDVFLDLAEWNEIVPQRSALNQMKELSKQLRLSDALEQVAHLLHVGGLQSFSVTANFVGKRNYNADEIKKALASGITARFHWEYTNEDLSSVNLRVFIEHDTAYVGLRLSVVPMHSRRYKLAHISGSLKPSVAAAMLDIAGMSPGQRLLDPLCGAGTIPIEAALSGAYAWGGDSSFDALIAASTNARAAEVAAHFDLWDARRLPLADGSIERVVTNLPWGRQVVVDEQIADLYARVCQEMERVLAPSGGLVLLTSQPQMVQFERLKALEQTEISLFGQTPVIMRFV